MILDAYRLRLWLQKENLSEDLKETIEWFIAQEEEYRAERQLWDEQFAGLTKENEGLKKTIADAIEAVKKIPETPVTRVVADEKILTSKFAGNCTECSGAYQVGDKIRWTPGVKGAKHVAGECE